MDQKFIPSTNLHHGKNVEDVALHPIRKGLLE